MEGVIKINSDGSIREEDGVASTGGVARDSEVFKAAWCKLYRGISEPLVIEALALRDAVLFAKENLYGRVTFESDCAELVRLWFDRNNQRAIIAPLLQEIEELSIHFVSFSIKHVRRSANSVAHECARYACVHHASMVWVGASPQFLKHCIQADGGSAILS